MIHFGKNYFVLSTTTVLVCYLQLINLSDSRNLGQQDAKNNIRPEGQSDIQFLANNDEHQEYLAEVQRIQSAANTELTQLLHSSQDDEIQAARRDTPVPLNSDSEKCPPLPIISKPELCQASKCETDEDCQLRHHQNYLSLSQTRVALKRSNAAAASIRPISTTATSLGDDDSSTQDLICCFNGCTKSCVHKVDSPLAFDWLEETEYNKFEYSTTNNNNHSGNTGGSFNDPNLFSPPISSSGSSSSASTSSSSSSLEDTVVAGGDYDYYDEGPPHQMFSHRLQPKTLIMNSKSARETIVLPGGCRLKSQQYEDLLVFRKNGHVTSCTCMNDDVVCEVNLEKTRREQN